MGETRPRPAMAFPARAIVLPVLALVLVGAGFGAWLFLAYGEGTEADRARLEVIKTAGAIAIGTGGLAALWLAARRQWASEVALFQKDVDQAHQERVLAATEADAAERRVTDLYTKAVEQLGSDKAPVRLGGMYALERLAQDVPRQRQTIVNVLCAYLRMPYEPPLDPPPESDAGGDDRERREQERQVRMTAQRILIDHLWPGDDPDNPAETFWPDIDLDLTGATLLDFDFVGGHIKSARFTNAYFSNTTWFDAARFSGDVWFDYARFDSDASFTNARFDGRVSFGGARFSGDVMFGIAQFGGSASFYQSCFDGVASFTGAQFSSTANFVRAQFSGGTRFGFSGGSSFGVAQFTGLPAFSKARVRIDNERSVQWEWPAGYVLRMPATEDAGHLPDAQGVWGILEFDHDTTIDTVE